MFYFRVDHGPRFSVQPQPRRSGATARARLPCRATPDPLNRQGGAAPSVGRPISPSRSCLVRPYLT